MSRRLAIVLGVPLLCACTAMGLAGVEATAVATAVAAPAAVAAGAKAPRETEVYGTYKDGFWFDRDLFSVVVFADSPQEAERVARDTAGQSCARRARQLQVIRSSAWQERALFIPIRLDRYATEMRFRCVKDAAQTLGGYSAPDRRCPGRTAGSTADPFCAVPGHVRHVATVRAG